MAEQMAAVNQPFAGNCIAFQGYRALGLGGLEFASLALKWAPISFALFSTFSNHLP